MPSYRSSRILKVNLGWMIVKGRLAQSKESDEKDGDKGDSAQQEL